MISKHFFLNPVQVGSPSAALSHDQQLESVQPEWEGCTVLPSHNTVTVNKLLSHDPLRSFVPRL